MAVWTPQAIANTVTPQAKCFHRRGRSEKNMNARNAPSMTVTSSRTHVPIPSSRYIDFGNVFNSRLLIACKMQNVVRGTSALTSIPWRLQLLIGRYDAVSAAALSATRDEPFAILSAIRYTYQRFTASR